MNKKKYREFVETHGRKSERRDRVKVADSEICDAQDLAYGRGLIIQVLLPRAKNFTVTQWHYRTIDGDKFVMDWWPSTGLWKTRTERGYEMDAMETVFIAARFAEV
jgi:hypothetical protein